jgi:hypothetical protein
VMQASAGRHFSRQDNGMLAINPPAQFALRRRKGLGEEGVEQAAVGVGGGGEARLHKRTVEILDVVDAVLDLLAFSIELAPFGPVAFHVAIDMNLNHLVRREESVADALSQRIGVNRRAKISMLDTYSVSFGVAVRPSASRRRNIRGFRARRNPQPRCRDGTRRSR